MTDKRRWCETHESWEFIDMVDHTGVCQAFDARGGDIEGLCQMMEREQYLIGTLNRTGRTYASSWADHVLVAEYTYGPLGERTWGKTLCGRKGSMASGRILILQELAERVPNITDLCGTCRRAVKSQMSWAFPEVHP